MWKNEYMGLCFNSLELNDIQDGFKIKHDHFPSRLFRFRAPTGYTIDEIQNQYVRIVSPEIFNDLLDTRAKVDFSDKFYGDNPSLKESYRQVMQKHLLSEKLDNILERQDWFEEILKACSIKIAEENNISVKDYQDMLKMVVDDEIIELNEVAGSLGHHIIRCCCFTESKDNLAMWYHYAGQYSGVCIEYDMSRFDEFDLQRRCMHPVIYTNDRPNIYNQIINFKPRHVNIYTQVSLQKKLEWQYENEWRLIFSGIYREDTNINFPVISAIYFGNKIEKQYRDRIVELARNMKIDIYDMRLVNNTVSFIKIK